MTRKKSLKILIVEDNISDAELAIRELKKGGLEFEHRRVDNREDFLKNLNDFKPDLIISDYMMPSYNGMKALLDAKEFDLEVPFILFTGSINEETAVECLKAGADDYILKDHLTRLPYSVKEVLIKGLGEKEKRAADLLLKENEEKLQSIFRAAPVGIGVVVKRIFIEVNDTFCRMIGYSRKELIGKSSEMIYASKEDFVSVGVEKYRQIDETGTGSMETRFKCKDGSNIDVLLSSTPLDKNDLLKGVTFTVMDITDRKRAEEALIESETKYRQLVTQSPDGIFIIDLSGKFISVNEAICKGLNYTEEELFTLNLLEIVPEKYHALYKQRLMAIMNGESTNSNAEYEIKGKNGISYFVEVLSVPYFKGKEIIGFQGIARDITERKRVEKILMESEEKYRRIFENVQDVYYETSIEGKILEISPSIESLSKNKYHRDDLIGKSMFDFYSDPNERTALISKLLKYGAVSDFEITLKNKDGSKVPCSVSSKICMDSQGRPEKIIGSMRDITDRKFIEEELKKNQDQLINAQIIARLGSWEYEVENDIFTFNDPFYAIFRTTAEEVGGYTMKSADYAKRFVHPDDMDMVGLETRKAIETDDPDFNRQLEHRIIYADGETGFIAVRFYIVKNEKGKTVRTYGVNQDITERKRVELELKKAADLMKLAKEKAEASDKLKTTFLNNISHEVRTPLNGILGFAEIISQTDLSEEEKSISYTMLNESTDRLLSTITNYMDISLINSGTMSVNNNDFSPDDLLSELYANYRIKCLARNLELILETPDRSDKLRIYSDQEIVRKILIHLLNNAIKFTEKGVIKFGYTIRKNELEFFIQDTGIGIGEESREDIFKHFIKEDRGPHVLSEGSGLGLSISKGLAGLLGGKITVESEILKGSTFFFTLPVKEESGDITLNNAGSSQNGSRMSNCILVAEDDTVNFYYIKALLQKNTSADIIYASNGKEAVDKFKQNPDVGLILMDIKMPVMDGLEATQQIKAIKQDVPIIAITAYAMVGDEARILAAGCDEYLIKPINKKLLLDKISKYVIMK